MKFKREDYIAFLETEYDTQMKEYSRLIATKATPSSKYVSQTICLARILSGRHPALLERWQVTKIGGIWLGLTFENNINAITLMRIASGFQNQKTLHFV